MKRKPIPQEIRRQVYEKCKSSDWIKVEPYPSCEGRWFKECKEPKLKKMVRECPRFKRFLEEVELVIKK